MRGRFVKEDTFLFFLCVRPSLANRQWGWRVFGKNGGWRLLTQWRLNQTASLGLQSRDLTDDKHSLTSLPSLTFKTVMAGDVFAGRTFDKTIASHLLLHTMSLQQC